MYFASASVSFKIRLLHLPNNLSIYSILSIKLDRPHLGVFNWGPLGIDYIGISTN